MLQMPGDRAKAIYCKQKIKCKNCAQEHDSRHCNVESVEQKKCANCMGNHVSTSTECPVRKRLEHKLNTAREKQTQKIPTLDEFPTLQVHKQQQKEEQFSLTEILKILSQPDTQEILSMIMKILNKIAKNPQIMQNINQILRNFNI